MSISYRFIVYAGLITYGIFTLFPLFWMVITSMKSGMHLFRLPPTFAPDLLLAGEPFKNYATVLSRPGFLVALANSTIVATTAAIGQLITCSMAGFVFARTNLPYKNFIYVLLLATLFFPVEVTLIPEFLLFKMLGWLDSLLPLIVPSFFVGAFGTLMMTEYFKSVPSELEEAALMDGAKSFHIFFYIHIPLAGPALASLFVIAFIINWDELLRPLIFNSSPSAKTLPQVLIDFVGQYEAQWSLLLSGSFLSTLPLIVVYLAMQRWVVEGFTRVGIK